MNKYSSDMDDFDPILPEGFGTRSVGHQQADLESSGTAYQPRTSRPVNRQRRAKAQTPLQDIDKRESYKSSKIVEEKNSGRIKSPKKEKLESIPLTETGFVKFFTDRRTHMFIGIVFIVVALMLAVFIVSHFKHGAADQSQAMNTTINQMVLDGKTANAGGPIGAKLSYIFVNEWLGLGSIAFIIYFAVIGLGLLGIKKVKFWAMTFQTLLIAITTSVVLGLVSFDMPTTFSWGGAHGHYVNQYLFDVLGDFGPLALSVVLIGAIFAVYFNRLANFYRARKAEYEARKQRRIAREETFRRKQEEAEAALAKIKEEEDEEELEELLRDEDENDDPIDATINSITDVITLDDIQEDTSYPDEDLPSVDIDATSDIDNADQSIEIEHKEDSVESVINSPRPDATVSEDDGFDVNVNQIEEAKIIDDELYDPTAELSKYQRPSIELLEDHHSSSVNVDFEEQEGNKRRIIKTLAEYGVHVSKIEATVGPTVTLFEILPAEGVRIATIKRLEDDIARSLAAYGIRIIAPIPGKESVGIEVPNRDPQTVSMRSVLASKKYQECKMKLPMAMGTTISNEVFIEDLAKMPHLLVAGATGQGKSVGLNAIITSLIYKRHPAELKFVLVDPKMVEFSLYDKLERHFLAKLDGEDDAIVTDPEKVKATLNSLCIEMDNRYGLLRDAYVRSLEEYNAKFVARKLNPEKGHKYLPYIVVIVDEFADLIMMAGKEVETPIARIAQKARAVGIHMIIATQRPSTNVITGIIKANFPGRIAFKVAQMVDSKTILDRTGANSLIGRGDMLFSHNGKLERVQCAFISTEEVESICEHIDSQVGYNSAYILPECMPDNACDGMAGSNYGDRDSKFEECARFIVSQSQQASVSSLQRRFEIGYNRAGKIMDQMEAAGIVSPANGQKPRNVLVDSITLEHILGNH